MHIYVEFKFMYVQRYVILKIEVGSQYLRNSKPTVELTPKP